MKKFELIAIAGFVAMMFTSITFALATEQIRGAIADLSASEFTWDSGNFPGFYYDIDKNIGSEKITFSLSEATPASAALSDVTDANGNRGIVYTTVAQTKNFRFNLWGQYQVIGFMGEEYFAAYSSALNSAMKNAHEPAPVLYDESKNRNLMTNEQISRVLIDDDTETLVTTVDPLKLMEGYELAIKSVNANETKIILELKKNGDNVDTKIIQPSMSGAKVSDKTYYYRELLGNTNDIVTIAVHFKNIFHGSDRDSATIDGVFQISDTPTIIKADQEFGKMSIRTVDPTAMTITMDNKDNQIILIKNRDIQLMNDIHIKTSNQNTTDDVIPLRYYIYKEVKCEY